MKHFPRTCWKLENMLVAIVHTIVTQQPCLDSIRRFRFSNQWPQFKYRPSSKLDRKSQNLRSHEILFHVQQGIGGDCRQFLKFQAQILLESQCVLPTTTGVPEGIHNFHFFLLCGPLQLFPFHRETPPKLLYVYFLILVGQ